jgi:hypothetical protein
VRTVGQTSSVLASLSCDLRLGFPKCLGLRQYTVLISDARARIKVIEIVEKIADVP